MPKKCQFEQKNRKRESSLNRKIGWQLNSFKKLARCWAREIPLTVF